MDEKLSSKLSELQILEQNLQNFLMQKQAFQVELNETNTALDEISNAKEVYKILSGVMILSNKDNVKKDLEEKKKIMDLRVSSIEKQEKLLESKSEKLREELNELVSRENSKTSDNK